jgi:hypothetical protein
MSDRGHERGRLNGRYIGDERDGEDAMKTQYRIQKKLKKLYANVDSAAFFYSPSPHTVFKFVHTNDTAGLLYMGMGGFGYQYLNALCVTRYSLLIRNVQYHEKNILREERRPPTSTELPRIPVKGNF